MCELLYIRNSVKFCGACSFLVLLYLVSCIFFYGLFSFDVSLSLPCSFSVLPFFNSNWLPLLHSVLPGFAGEERQLIFTKKENLTQNYRKKELKVVQGILF